MLVTAPVTSMLGFNKLLTRSIFFLVGVGRALGFAGEGNVDCIFFLAQAGEL